MSWIKTEDGDLLNLDLIAEIQVFELEENEKGDTHAVAAFFDGWEVLEDGRVLRAGSEIQCLAVMTAITAKLHMVMI